MMRALGMTLAATCFLNVVCSAQANLHGRVVDQAGAAFNPSAIVRVVTDSGAQVSCGQTDATGAFSFMAAPQQFRVSIYGSPTAFRPFSVERTFTPSAIEDFTPQMEDLAPGPGGFGSYLQIQDSDGCPIKGAYVGVQTKMGYGPELNGQTQEDGYFFISPFAEAPFSVSVAASGYVPIANQDLPFGKGSRLVVAMTRASSTSGETLGSDGPRLAMLSAPAMPTEISRTLEYGVQVSGGVGLEDRTNFSFLNAGVHAGKVLTGNYGQGALRANFEYGVEVLPLWQSYTPKFQRLNCPANATTAAQCFGPTTTGGTYRGVSITPIILRINFTHGERIMPWIQGAGGVLYTSRKYPGIGNLNVGDATQTGPAADTSVWNFTPQGGVGMHYFVKPRRSLDFSVNAEHISSASLGDKNPGVNDSLQFAVGYSWWK